MVVDIFFVLSLTSYCDLFLLMLAPSLLLNGCKYEKPKLVQKKR